MSGIDRKTAIDFLESEATCLESKCADCKYHDHADDKCTVADVYPNDVAIAALKMAIRCLKVDEMYDLSYEDADWYDKAIKENERLKKELEMLKLDRECDKPSGKWIERDDGWGGTYYDCSVCGGSWTTIDGTPFDYGMKYCPNCGAKMEQGDLE